MVGEAIFPKGLGGWVCSLQPVWSAWEGSQEELHSAQRADLTGCPASMCVCVCVHADFVPSLKNIPLPRISIILSNLEMHKKKARYS